MLNGRNIVLGVTGGIAAYKAADLCSQLRKAGANVRVAMTSSSTYFVAPLTFETLAQYPVYSSVLKRPASYEMEHISWAKWADLFVIAPASANTIAKLAGGLADDPVSTFYLAFPGKVVVAPAMNTQMLLHPATQANLQTLRQRGVTIVEPDSGMLACGDVGAGKLASIERIVALLQEMDFGGVRSVAAATAVQAAAPGAPGVASTVSAEAAAAPNPVEDDSLAGRTVLITSGPTHEYLDPVRFLTNPSSGKMGAALAREAVRRGATVHLVSGPVNPALLPKELVKLHKVTTAEQMLAAVKALAPQVDLFIFAAAVTDFRVANPVSQKIKRTGNSLALPLIENPDIAQAVGCIKKPGQVSVGFAAETQDVEQNALGKMARKHLDAIVANDVANPRIGFERDENEVTVYLRTGERRHISRRPKTEVAREIFEALTGLLAAPTGEEKRTESAS